MESPLAYAPLLFTGLGVVWLFYAASRRQGRESERAMLEAFAHGTPTLWYDSRTEALRGEIDGVVVRVSFETVREGPSGSDLRVTRFQLRDRQASMLCFEPHAEAAGSIRTGDPVFDDAVALRGPRGEALAALGPQARRRVATAVARGWVCADGVWTHQVSRRIDKHSELKARLALCLDACLALRSDGPHELALAERVLGDDLVEVRHEALAALLAEGAPPQEMEARLLAEHGPVAVPVAAHLPVPRDVEQLAAFVDHEDPETSWLATQELLRRDVEAAVVRRGLVRGLDGAWCGAAIEELGRRGEVADVPALRALTEGWLSRHGDAAEAAIQAIQSRARGAGVGQLALAEARGDGAVSVVEEVDDAQRSARRAADRRPEG